MQVVQYLLAVSLHPSASSSYNFASIQLNLRLQFQWLNDFKFLGWKAYPSNLNTSTAIKGVGLTLIMLHLATLVFYVFYISMLASFYIVLPVYKKGPVYLW